MSDLIITPPARRCAKCGNEYPATTEYFYASGTSLTALCKTCYRQKQAAYRAQHPDRVKDANRAWYEKNRTDISERNKQKRRDNPKPKREYVHPEFKTCTRCHETFPASLEFFYANRGVRSGLTAQCRDCVLAGITEKRREDPEPHRAAARRYYRSHKEQCAERSAQWQRENPQKTRASVKKWMEKHPGYAREYARRYYHEHHDKVLDQKRRWRAANPDLARSQWQRRYARQKAAPGYTTADDLAAIRAAQTDNRGRLLCWACGKPITDTPHLDHWIPLSSGGTHDPGNLRYMHAYCNQSKGGKHPAELGRLI